MIEDTEETFDDHRQWERFQRAIAERKVRYAERSFFGKIELYIKELWEEEKQAWKTWNYHRKRYFSSFRWKEFLISSTKNIVGLIGFFTFLTILVLIKILLFGVSE